MKNTARNSVDLQITLSIREVSITRNDLKIVLGDGSQICSSFEWLYQISFDIYKFHISDLESYFLLGKLVIETCIEIHVNNSRLELLFQSGNRLTMNNEGGIEQALIYWSPNVLSELSNVKNLNEIVIDRFPEDFF